MPILNLSVTDIYFKLNEKASLTKKKPTQSCNLYDESIVFCL